jgi:long-chain acyl-CoA synthetase
VTARTVVHALLANAEAVGDREALRCYDASATVTECMPWRALAEAAVQVGAALVGQGSRIGDTVAVLAGNGVTWPVADLGILMSGGVSVGIHPTSTPEQVAQVLRDSGAHTVIVDGALHLEAVRWARSSTPALRQVIVAGAATGGPGESTWTDWLASGGAAESESVARRIEVLQPESDAVLIYTSGSTGTPRGARLSHGCLVASARSIGETLGLRSDDTGISFLPFSHAAERIFGHYTRIVHGMAAGVCADPRRVWDVARAYRPTVFGAVPRFFEKASAQLHAMKEAAGAEEQSRWEAAIRLGTERSRLRRAGASVPGGLESAWRSASESLQEHARAVFGGAVRLATSGGATLPTSAAEHLDALGVTVLGAYGLTEHLCAAFNRPDCYDFESAGPPMPGTTIRIDTDGEILLARGPLTFSGYFGCDAETRDVFTHDGEWLRTGDLGAITARGCLTVTGRRKELIALSTGKKVAPGPIEARLTSDPLLGHAMLAGEGRPFVTALLWPRGDAVAEWAAAQDLGNGNGSLGEHPAVRARIQAVIDRVNAGLSPWERIARFRLLPDELTVEGGDLTPSHKLRRAALHERHTELLHDLYG